MKLLWQIDTQVDPRYLSLMQTAADCALWMEGVSRPCAVNIRICGDDAIHEINHEYRGVDRATDVLSFPTVNYPAGKTAGQCDKLLARELDDEVDACMLGDLITPCRMCWRRRRSMAFPGAGGGVFDRPRSVPPDGL